LEDALATKPKTLAVALVKGSQAVGQGDNPGKDILLFATSNLF
jgi:hypothetical protein